jgi:dephospho-CoA kinase
LTDRQAKKKPFVLGVTGGIASGKSTVSAMLVALGAPLVDFDELARKVVEPGRPALAAIADYFGRAVLLADGTLDRKKLADIVFNKPDQRRKLEEFTHAAIFTEYHDYVSRLAADHPGGIIQAAVPLLMELNLESLFNKVLLVYAPPGQQVARLAARDGISADAAANILKSQLPIDAKVDRADYVIDNGGSREKTRLQVNTLWQELCNEVPG